MTYDVRKQTILNIKKCLKIFNKLPILRSERHISIGNVKKEQHSFVKIVRVM